MPGPRLSMVAAVAENGVIGSAGRMPWRLSSDMKRFRRLTMGKPVIMGRKTYASIGRPLDGRENIVVTRQPRFSAPGVVVAASLDAAIARGREAADASSADEVMVLGGGEIYAAAIGRADRLYITHVGAAPDGDTRFPAIDPSEWVALSEEALPAGERDTAATRFVVYERRRYA